MTSRRKKRERRQDDILHRLYRRNTIFSWYIIISVTVLLVLTLTEAVR